MYKNQLQELAQRSCFNLPSYASVREGPDHAPRFKAAVKFNGETFESPSYCSTLRQAEHSAAEVALNALSCRGPSNSMAARILEETGVYKNLLQEVSQRVGASLPTYTTVRTGAGHLPIFTCTVELAGVVFTGEPAKNKKQAEKNAAMSAWLSLKSLVQQSESSPSERPHKDEQEHVVVARELQKYLIKARLARMSFPIKFPTVNTKPSTPQHSPATSSKILPLICPTAASHNRPVIKSNSSIHQKAVQKTTIIPNSSSSSSSLEYHRLPPQAAGAAPYIPVSRCYPNHRVAPPVTIRNSVPVFSAPAFAPPQSSVVLRAQPQVIRAQALNVAPPVDVRQVVPVFAAPVKVEDPRIVRPPMKLGDPFFPKMPVVRAEERKLHAVSVVPKFEAETLHTQLESVISMVSAEEGTKSSVKAEAKELSEIEAIKDLKI